MNSHPCSPLETMCSNLTAFLLNGAARIALRLPCGSLVSIYIEQAVSGVATRLGKRPGCLYRSGAIAPRRADFSLLA